MGERIQHGAAPTGPEPSQVETHTTQDLKALQAENDHLRASLANSGGPCAYCALSKERWGECADGFPGCARGDDAMLCPHVGAELEAREEVDALRLLLRRNEVRVGRERELLAETTRLLERARAAEAALAESERKRVEERAALAALYEWYDRDGSVGGANDVFSEHRALLAREEAEHGR